MTGGEARLIRIRDLNLTQEEVAKALGLEFQTVQLYETASMVPSNYATRLLLLRQAEGNRRTPPSDEKPS